MTQASTRTVASITKRLCIGALIALALAWWWRDADTSSPVVAAPTARSAEEPTPETKALLATLPPGSRVREKVERSLIERIDYDPISPCLDEPVVVHVTPTPEGALSKFYVNGKPGTDVVYTFPSVGKQQLGVAADDWSLGVQYKRVEITVRDCGERPALQIKTQRLRDSAIAFTLVPRRLVEPVRYEIDFGDDSRIERSTLPTAWHSYWNRPQNVPASAFIVRVTATDANGVTVRGATNVGFQNNHFISALNGEPHFPSVLEAPAETRAGRVFAQFSVKNILPLAARFHTAKLRTIPCEANVAFEERTVPAHEIGADVTIAGAVTMSVNVAVPLSLFEHRVCALGAVLIGTLDGVDEIITARTQLSLPVGVPDYSPPGERPALAGLIAEAQQRFPGRALTEEDVFRLNAEGQLGRHAASP